VRSFGITTNDIEKLLTCIQKQLKIQSRAHDNRMAQIQQEELFSSESEIVI
jgi:hypothetical protein